MFNKVMWEAAAWTFLETFFASLAPAIVGAELGDWGALTGIAASAAISALAAVFSLVKSWSLTRLAKKESIFLSA